jgi:hypothetical protein
MYVCQWPTGRTPAIPRPSSQPPVPDIALPVAPAGFVIFVCSAFTSPRSTRCRGCPVSSPGGDSRTPQAVRDRRRGTPRSCGPPHAISHAAASSPSPRRQPHSPSARTCPPGARRAPPSSTRRGSPTTPSRSAWPPATRGPAPCCCGRGSRPTRTCYVRVRLTPETARADFTTVSAVTTPGAPITTAASFVTEAGAPGLKPAQPEPEPESEAEPEPVTAGPVRARSRQPS